MTAALWPRSFDQFRDANGLAYRGAIASFYDGGSTNPRVVYQDNDLSTPWGSSVIADANGFFPAVFLPDGLYNFRVTTASGVQIVSGGPINPMPYVATGGGGGGVVDPTTIFQTGDILWVSASGVRTGWVRCNGRTIGNSVSGATERANADCADLFEYVWNTYSDAIAPVSGGRGGTGAADFAAGKTIQLLDFRGRLAIGLDNMGNVDANRVQITTTLTTTASSVTATLGSAAGVGKGMYVLCSTLPANTYIADISGTTVTLSAAASSDGVAVACRVSYINDPTVAGTTGGAPTSALTSFELPAHSHTGTTDSSGVHSHTVSIGNNGTPGGAATAGSSSNTTSTTTDGAHTHNFTTAVAGSSLPFSNLPPVVTGTFYQKL